MDNKLKVEKRELTGRKVKSLRREGILPGNVYGKKIESFPVQVTLKEFEPVYEEVGETGLLELLVDKKKVPVLITEVQAHPVSGLPLHVDFRQVDLKEKVVAMVPLELVGESPAEKSGLGTVIQQLNEVEAEALPVDLPDKIEVDLSGLEEVDEVITAKDLKYNKEKISLKILPDQVIVKVEPPQKEEEVLPPQPTEEEVPLEGEEVPAEAKEEAATESPEKGQESTKES
jgi:large subunit ribosomal protein L25